MNNITKITRCNFCGRVRHEAKWLVSSCDVVFICDKCIQECVYIMVNEGVVIDVPEPTKKER